MNTSSLPAQVSLIHALGLPDHSVSTHLIDLGRRFDTLPLSATAFRLLPVQASPLIGRLADLPGRIEFVILRTDRSPPAALHPASGRRSCSRLQAGERMPEEDSHLSDQTRFQAHQPSLRDEEDGYNISATTPPPPPSKGVTKPANIHNRSLKRSNST